MPENMEGTRPLTGPALPNLINAVKMFKVNVNTNVFISAKTKAKPPRFCGLDFDFNILTAFIRLGRARPEGAGCPP